LAPLRPSGGGAQIVNATKFVRATASVLTSALIFWVPGARAQTPVLPLPTLSKCPTETHPQLPEKWRATFLLAPFTNTQLVLGNLAYDGTLKAMRASLYGLKRGTLDLFVQGDHTYALTSRGPQIVGCENLGDTGWRPFPQDWLKPQSQCAGSGPLAETAVDWWKTPIEPRPSSYWIWYKTSDQTPFRLVFPFPNDRLAVLGEFALSYQISFEQVENADLSEPMAACKSATVAIPEAARQRPRERINAMSLAEGKPSDEIKRLLPQVSACPSASLPRWPEKVALTGLMTPFDFNEVPYQTEVLYDWTIPAQRSRIYFPQQSSSFVQDALMLESGGYNVTYYRQGAPTCRGLLPGTIRPDWAARAPCSCEAMIDGNTPLTPYGATRVISCPLASPRAAWAWYTRDDRPMTFAVTSLLGDEGSGLFAVLDYRDWIPGAANIARAAFNAPAHCGLPPLERSALKAQADPASRQCSTCHTGSDPR